MILDDYYDRQGRPISAEDWVKPVYRSREYKRVAEDHVGDIYISTVWLGFNHQYGEGPPLIFETMIFGSGDHDEWYRRYSTEAEAKAGHVAAVAWVCHEGPEPKDAP